MSFTDIALFDANRLASNFVSRQI